MIPFNNHIGKYTNKGVKIKHLTIINIDMDKKDIQLLCENYGRVLPQPELFIEASGMMPTIIKVSEIYEGGPKPGRHDIEYKIVERQGNRVKAICASNPDLVCKIDVNDGDVTIDDSAYHTSVTFHWDDARKAYTALESPTPPAPAIPNEEDAQLIDPGTEVPIG